MQEDGNLVITSSADPEVLWQTGTGGHPGSELVMEDDGNLLVKSLPPDLWESGTSGNPGASYSMQEDGNLVISSAREAVWATGTWGNPGATMKFVYWEGLQVVSTDGQILWRSDNGYINYALQKYEFTDDGELRILAE